MKRILVIGASGFVGLHTLRWLDAFRKKGEIELIAGVRRADALGDFSGELRVGDLRDSDYIDALLEGVDIVVNAMAWSALYGHAKESKVLFLNPTLALIDAYERSEATRFINISTLSAALAGQAEPDEETLFIPGMEQDFWPHLSNIVKIENRLRTLHSAKAVINLRLGIFVGAGYGIGIIPILLPRLKTHLVPWVAGGRTHLPLVDGRDIGQALGKAALLSESKGFRSFNILGKRAPSVRELLTYIHQKFDYPKPHFSVPFWIAYPFAWLMEKLDILVPWEPLIVRSIVHLLEDTYANNEAAESALGYRPLYDWKRSVDLQIEEMHGRQRGAMSMIKEIKK